MQDESRAMPPGWYPDPSLPGQLRYWTGSSWSADVRPAPPPPGAVLARPWWQQWWAIILTLLVCFPLGVIGVWQRQGTAVGVKVAVTALALVLYAGVLSARAQS
jgi:hypothetical protein